jgi:ParB/RepB/Spo0J family partition protein
MMTKKAKAAPAPAAASSPVNAALAAWPFPKSPQPREVPNEEEGRVPPEDMAAHSTERIRVDQVRLFTDPSQNTAQLLSLEQLVESPFNPRTRYDEKALNELAETIRGVGVHSPILVRRTSVDAALAFNRDNPDRRGEVPEFELVFGHRRFRAARIAGETTIPAFVRELTDAQAAQLQAIENVQRQNPDAIDEASGYQHYLQAHGVTADQLADEIGVSRTHVYNRLKLLNAVAPVQEALRAGTIGAEVALLVARIHSPKLQEKALASLQSNHHSLDEGGKRSYRGIKSFLKEKFTLRLKDAIFPTDDAKLLEGADACTACPKRSGNAVEYQDLVADDDHGGRYAERGEPNLCTDPECFDAKKKQHLANKEAELVAKGKTVISGAKARAAIGADGTVKGAYIALKDVKGELAKAKKAGKGGEVQTITIQDPRTGKLVEAVKRDEVKTAGVKVKDQPKQGGRYDYEADRRRQEAERAKNEATAAVETKVYCAILGAVRQEAAAVARSAFDLQMVAQVTLEGVEWDAKGLLAQLHGFNSFEKLQKAVGSMAVEQLTTLMLDCALVEGVQVRAHQLKLKPDALLAAAKHYEVDVATIRAEVSESAADTKTQDLLQSADQAGDEQQDEEEGAEA